MADMAVKGSVLGDILGAQYEFDRPKDLDWKNIPLTVGEAIGYTDDTVMTLAIKKAILTKTELVDTMVSVGREYPFAGYGERFFNWINGNNHEPYNSWGNGSAMRVSFVGEYYDDYDEMQDMAKTTAMVSHNHPEGVKGAVVTASCIWMAKHGKSKQDIYDYVLDQYPKDEYEYSIFYSLDEIRGRYKWTESCMGSVAPAMRCFYESHDYESFIRNVFSLECDSDTFGAIAGGVAEEFYGGFGEINAEELLGKYLTQELFDILEM